MSLRICLTRNLAGVLCVEVCRAADPPGERGSLEGRAFEVHGHGSMGAWRCLVGVNMASENLKNKPLVEAVFELRWKPEKLESGLATDPHFSLLLGRFFDRVKDEYPAHEELPSAKLPAGVGGQNVQHRFRAAANEWPVLQIGPGVMTVNDTDGYRWGSFRERCSRAIDTLYDSHPRPEEMRVDALILRYIDAHKLEHSKHNCLDFLREKMKLNIALPEGLFGKNVERSPVSFDLRTSFRSTDPNGLVRARFATGARDREDALIWETIVHSSGAEEIPPERENFLPWLESAHSVSHRWFMTLIKGDLKREYSGER